MLNHDVNELDSAYFENVLGFDAAIIHEFADQFNVLRHPSSRTTTMSPIPHLFRRLHDAPGDQSQKPTDPDSLVLEAWAEGYMIGSLIIMTCITIANMRRGVLLHKLILIEVWTHSESYRKCVIWLTL